MPTPRAVLLFLATLLLALGPGLGSGQVSGLSAAGGGAQAAPAGDASARHAKVFYQLGSGPGLVRPRRIFTAFSSSPTYVRLTWRKWGTEHAVATGVLDNTCGACSGGTYRGKVYFDGATTCADTGTTIYRRARGTYRDEGTTRRVRLYSTCPVG